MLTTPRDIAHAALETATTLHRQARIALSVATLQGDLDAIRIRVYAVRHAARAERSARRAFAPFKRAERIAARAVAARAKRYHYQHARKGVTTDQRAELRNTRAERRQAAALATTRKRAANVINGIFAVPD